ncbi:MAG: hypothetical protein V1897_19860 [Pseudomonadota bacterium]
MRSEEEIKIVDNTPTIEAYCRGFIAGGNEMLKATKKGYETRLSELCKGPHYNPSTQKVVPIDFIERTTYTDACMLANELGYKLVPLDAQTLEPGQVGGAEVKIAQEVKVVSLSEHRYGTISVEMSTRDENNVVAAIWHPLSIGVDLSPSEAKGLQIGDRFMLTLEKVEELKS